jgi:hypothetical protein
MSSSWQIHQRVMLGVTLAFGMLALLLCGTIWALWSDYDATGSIRGKLNELKAAEEFKEAVTHLTTTESLRQQLHNPSHADILLAFRNVRNKRKEYQGFLKENRNQGRAPSNLRDHRQVLAQALIGLIDDLEKEGYKIASKPTANRHPQAADDDLAALKKKADPLIRTARDLQQTIHEDLTERFAEKRRQSQVSLLVIVPTGVSGLMFLLGLMAASRRWQRVPAQARGEAAVAVRQCLSPG